MKFIYGKQDLSSLSRAQETCWLLTNGLGGFASLSAAFSASRGDQGLLIAAATAPSERIALVQGLSEWVTSDGRQFLLSSQEFADGTPPEEGFRNLSSFCWGDAPAWQYDAYGIHVCRSVYMEQEKNTTAVLYELTNTTDFPCTLKITPRLLCKPKGAVRRRTARVQWDGERVLCGGYATWMKATGGMHAIPIRWEAIRYRDDEKDGRNRMSRVFSCARAECTAAPGQTIRVELVFSDQPIVKTGSEIREDFLRHTQALTIPFRTPEARVLARSAAAFITRRDSTGGKTIVAGYPFFGDWGRDTMIALPGCVLAANQRDTAVSILRTFLAYEQEGLVPNLFPEGNAPPRYNTADAALLLINCLWLYHQKYRDDDFIREAYPVLRRIIEAYRRGTRHGIRMDADALIQAGEGLDQVTWMDVCVDGILPTPRHGKPVEINAYWYNALRIMEAFAPIAGEDGTAYGALAQQVKASFTEKFWMEDRGYLKDVLSGTPADNQIRCNQIWAVTMPFTMLSARQEAKVVQTVYRELYTPCGLRTLSSQDPEFHPTYGGPQLQRDLAYHQGTVWVFPLGAYYRAYLKVGGFSRDAAASVRRALTGMESMLREGCVGQLPEIYDGGNPAASRGCFAQAWSVGEMLTVYELLEQIEQEEQ